jgi:hypothetical protein
MDIAVVRKRLHDAMERARRRAAERRVVIDQAGAAFASFMSGTAIPLVRQVANVLKTEGYLFSVFTPAGSVRLMSDKNADDFIEITLDASVDTPRVVARISSHGRRLVDMQRVIGSGDPAVISEEELFAFLLKELEPFVER